MAKLPRMMNKQIGVLSPVDLRNMRMFRQVTDAGGITAAVERFDLEKTAVSRAIRALEERLDGVLCTRGPKGFALTEFGRQVYQAAAAVEDAVDRARIEINRAHRTLEGEVRLGLTDNCLTNPDAKISDAIEQFLQIAPSVRISTEILPADQLMQALRDREVHLAVAPMEHAGGDSFTAEPLFSELTRLYCCPQPDEIPPQFERLASRGYGVVVRRFRKSGAGLNSRQIKGAWTAEASGLEAVAILLNTGRCVGILPEHFVTGSRTRRPFVEVPGATHLRTKTLFCVAYEKERLVSQAVSAMRDCLVSMATWEMT